MSRLTVRVTVDGPDAEDSKTMEAHIDLENEWRAVENERLASLEPPGAPLEMLPKSNDDERKVGYETYLNRIVKGLHLSYLQTVKAEEAQQDDVKEDLKIIEDAYLAGDAEKRAAIVDAATIGD